MFSENRDFENMENIKNGVPFIKQVFNVFYVFQNKNLFLKIGTINCTTLSTYCLNYTAIQIPTYHFHTLHKCIVHNPSSSSWLLTYFIFYFYKQKL